MIGIIGLGFVGSAIYKSFELKGQDVYGYDKFKDCGIGIFEKIIETKICFLCLPTLYDSESGEYNKKSIIYTLDKLRDNNYKGLVVIKSTVEPETTDYLSVKYPTIKLCHNPEFLSARTAFTDFHTQTHIIVGKPHNRTENDILELYDLYTKYFPDANLSKCSALESESVKIMCNTFYASKIIIFNEFYLLCKENGANFEIVRDLMLKNKWINSMHTNVPGTDGSFGFGGACFPKDISALLKYMKRKKIPNSVIESVFEENKIIRHSS